MLVNARLAPDMFPLSRQVQLSCDLAKNSVARLAAIEPPRFEDNEKTIEELRANWFSASRHKNLADPRWEAATDHRASRGAGADA